MKLQLFSLTVMAGLFQQTHAIALREDESKQTDLTQSDSDTQSEWSFSSTSAKNIPTH